MRAIRATLALLVLMAPMPLAAQATAPDSLVRRWLDRGIGSGWSPAELLANCPTAEAWQERDLTWLLAADLTPRQRHALAISWSIVMKCADPRVEDWLERHVVAAAKRGEPADDMAPFWEALGASDTPTLRVFLRQMLMDASVRDDYRNAAGEILFRHYSRPERLSEYLRVVDEGRPPFGFINQQTWIILRENAQGLATGLGDRLRARPERIAEMPFEAGVQLCGNAPRAARATLRDALAEAAEHAGNSEELRDKLRLQATWVAP